MINMVLIMCGFSKMAQQPIHLVVSLSLLREMLPGHVISLRGDIGWPPRSPDLTPCDFFLWGYLKAKVSEQRPLTLEALKEAIRQEVAAITKTKLRGLSPHANYTDRAAAAGRRS